MNNQFAAACRGIGVNFLGACRTAPQAKALCRTALLRLFYSTKPTMSRVAVVALLAAAVLATATATFVDCSVHGSHASNMKVSISPANPQPGQTYTYDSSYTLDETVTGGTAKYDIYLNGMLISSSSQDLCTSLAKSNTPCPLKKGPIVGKTTGTVPTDVPSGNLTSVTSWTDQNGQPVLCVDLQFQEN